MLCMFSLPTTHDFTKSASKVTTIERLKCTLIIYTDSAHGVITLLLCILPALKIPAGGYLEEGGSRGTPLHSYLGYYSAEETPLCDHSRDTGCFSELPGAQFDYPPMPLSPSESRFLYTFYPEVLSAELQMSHSIKSHWLLLQLSVLSWFKGQVLVKEGGNLLPNGKCDPLPYK